MKTWRVAGINFDHMHMGDNLRMAREHPRAEIVGVCHEVPERMEAAVRSLEISSDRVFTDYRECLESTRPDIVILCPATAQHGDWVERVAPFGAHVLLEKPFAASLAEADRIIAAVRKAGVRLAINWPLVWVPAHVTTKRLIDEGQIGEVLEVHFYDGNRGPLYHVADKVETGEGERAKERPMSWFYRKSYGGGSLLDYLGYGTTLGTWYQGNRTPLEVTAITAQPENLEVDAHSVTVARYAHGLSTFQTRWGTFTDPWVHQPQPKCGFVIVGTEGTIGSYDYAPTVRLQTRAQPQGMDVPVDPLVPPNQNPIQYFIHCLETGEPIEGPLSIEVSRIGQQVVESAIKSALEGRTMKVVD
ncbi:MAG: Gfo/Idh/MocA family oxidoreductase [Candidatus Hydrogenedentes bacterium]|nr:Gfo/Idh/MocA family oxidoreductase [Candidatus Hydrogenedentota bacterium]